MSFKPNIAKIELDNDSDIVAIIDGDWPIYSIACVGDDDYIEATHIKSGQKKEFKNKTEFQGRSTKTIGGWLAERNIEREEKGLPPFTKEDFELVKKKRRKIEYDDNGDERPLDESDRNMYHSAKAMIVSCLDAMNAGSYLCFHGGSGTYREDKSTLMKYKGNRDGVEKPLMFYDILDYVVKRFKSEKVEGAIETDDRVVMEAYQMPERVILGEDKDFRGQPIKFFDVNNPHEGIINGDCFGELEWFPAPKNKVLGYGRLFLYWQILCGDSSDNYKTNCFSSTKWAGKSAYEALASCQDDKEAWEILVVCFKELYPEKQKVRSWRDEEIEIDWLYVLREMHTLAKMLRWEGDEDTTMEDWMRELDLDPDEILR